MTYKFLGDQDFQGKQFLAYSVDEIDVSYYDPTGRFVGRMLKGAVRETNDPGFQSFARPLYVGRSWVHSFRFIDHAAGRTFDGVQFWSKVEVYEDVTTAAGTFKAFRIVHDNPSVQLTNWWSPDLSLVVKSKAERKVTYYAGAGLRETELKSLDLKK